MCDIHSELTINTPERYQWCHSGVFIVNLKQVLHIVMLFSFVICRLDIFRFSSRKRDYAD